MRLCTPKITSPLGPWLLGLLLVPVSVAQPSASSGSPSNNSAPLVAQDPAQVIQFLSRTISWHRQLEAESKIANRPTDLSFAQENLHIADQVVRLAFEYARGQAQLQSKQAPPPPTSSDENSARFQRLAQAVQKVEQQLRETQAEAQTLRQKLSRAPAAKKFPIESQLEEVQSEIGLLDARRDALQSMTEFVMSRNSGGSFGLRAQIEELAHSVPPQLSRPSASQDEVVGQSSSGSVMGGTSQGPSGIWELTGDLIRLSSKLHTLNDELSASEDLAADADKIRAPLVANMRNLIRRGDELSSAADSSGPAALEQQKKQLDALTGEFRQPSCFQ